MSNCSIHDIYTYKITEQDGRGFLIWLGTIWPVMDTNNSVTSHIYEFVLSAKNQWCTTVSPEIKKQYLELGKKLVIIVDTEQLRNNHSIARYEANKIFNSLYTFWSTVTSNLPIIQVKEKLQYQNQIRKRINIDKQLLEETKKELEETKKELEETKKKEELVKQEILTCHVCFEHSPHMQFVTFGKCGHTACSDCARDWLIKKKICITCNEPCDNTTNIYLSRGA